MHRFFFILPSALAFATSLTAGPVEQQSRLIETRKLAEGSASQGLALAENYYYGSTSQTICRFDTHWKFIDQKTIHVDGVNHVGAIHYHAGFLWAGLLHGPVDGKHDPKLDRSIVAKIRPNDLEVVKTWDISDDVTWVDPVYFDGVRLWVGDLSDLGIHRYNFVDGNLVRDGIFRYPKEMHFSQGIRIAGGKLYSIHTFGTMDGLFEFELPRKLDDSIQQPSRVWTIQERLSHLEGFAFVPGQPNQIWHAQGSEVDRYELEGLSSSADDPAAISYPLKVLPADHTILTDPATGVQLTFLTTKTSSSSIYFHERSWLADNSMIIFRGESGLMGYLTETGELVALTTPSGGVGAATAAAQRNSIFCMRGRDVLELTPRVELSPAPATTPSTVSGTERLIVTLPSGGQLNVSHDDQYLSVGLNSAVTTINVIRVADGHVREVCKVEPPAQWHGHLQWSRTPSNLLSFAGGDDWHREGGPDRIWVVDPTEGVPRPVYHQVDAELVTHESWWVDDQILYCGAPPAIGFQGDSTKRELSHVNVLDPRTGVSRILGAGSWWSGATDAEIWKRNWWHCAGSDDGRWVVADTFHGDLVLFEGATTRPRLLTTGHRTFGGGDHPEPGWDRRGEHVIFSSHRLSKAVNACVARLPPEWQSENSTPRNRPR